MIIYSEGTVFNAPVKTIVNTVNCKGVMGAGIALEFKLRFPEMFEDYVERCKNDQMKLGKPVLYEYSDDTWIMNFPTKGHWRFPSKIQWIEQGLQYFRDNYRVRNIESIAFPKLGTSNGGLDWKEVKTIMEKYLSDLDINVYICLDDKKIAEGTEKLMLDCLNYMTIEELIENIKLSKKQAQAIFKNLPYNRFWQISNLDGITENSYEKIFKYFYSNIKNDSTRIKNMKWEQLSLFDTNSFHM